jgi:hypothetical protein
MSEIFDGAFVRLPVGLVDRLVRHAGERMAAELRYTGTPEDLRANPDAAIELLAQFLNTRPGTITLPFPSAEPGDLLVKLGRAEFWTFTVHGWRELAPLELQPVFEPECGPQEAPDPLAAMRVHGLERSGAAAQAAEEATLSPIRAAAVELKILAGAVRRTIEVAERPDLGVDDRLRAFAEGLETAQRIIVGLER